MKSQKFKFIGKFLLMGLGGVIISFIPLIMNFRTGDTQLFISAFFGIIASLMVFMGLSYLIKKVTSTGAAYLVEEPKEGRPLLLVLSKGESYFAWGNPVPPGQIEDSKSGAIYEDASDFTTYLAGHNLKLVLTDVDHTLSPYIVQYTSKLKKELKFKGIDDLLEFQSFLKKNPEIEKLLNERSKLLEKLREINRTLAETEEDIYKKLEVVRFDQKVGNDL